MTESQMLILILGTSLIASNLFWLLCTKSLVDRLMSRNYHEFVVAKSQSDTQAVTTPRQTRQVLPEDFGVLEEFS